MNGMIVHDLEKESLEKFLSHVLCPRNETRRLLECYNMFGNQGHLAVMAAVTLDFNVISEDLDIHKYWRAFDRGAVTT